LTRTAARVVTRPIAGHQWLNLERQVPAIGGKFVGGAKIRHNTHERVKLWISILVGDCGPQAAVVHPGIESDEEGDVEVAGGFVRTSLAETSCVAASRGIA
jgi:hypothetical protein